jgi:hypothetical protein
MHAFGKQLGALFLLLEAAGPISAAIPESGIEVHFRDREPPSLPTSGCFGVPELRFDLKGGSLHPRGDRLRAVDLFLSGQSARIGQRIHDCSQNRTAIRILLGVSEETEFAAAAELIARLKCLAAAHASEKCNVLILVFPVPGAKKRPTPAAQQDVDGPAIPEDSIRIRFRSDGCRLLPTKDFIMASDSRQSGRAGLGWS